METIGPDLRQMQRIPLAPSHVAALRGAGDSVTYPAGAYLARPGEPADCFRYVEDGEIEVVDVYTGSRLVPSTLGPTPFMGEIALLDGEAWSMDVITAPMIPPAVQRAPALSVVAAPSVLSPYGYSTIVDCMPLIVRPKSDCH